ncbi:hypothetical protein Scep_010481 [Stephania cephalantha]|uniref:Uncharacterized protein n=1 Tax=Stephania cephalantha TaxID=152367 RepID=A0AAP0PH40_9MAGN
MVWRDVTKTTWYHGHVGIHLPWRSTAWSRGNPRVCYAFVLVHRVKLGDGSVGVRVTESSRERPKLDQGGAGRATRRRIAKASGVGGIGSRESAEHGAAERGGGHGGGNVGRGEIGRNPRRAGKRGANNGAGGENRAMRQAAASDDNLAQKGRASRVSSACFAEEEGRGRRVAVDVDDDNGRGRRDSGGEDCAAAGIVRRRGDQKLGFERERSRRMGALVFTLL